MQPARSKRPTGRRGCAGHTKAGDLCNGPAVDGTDLCRMHPGVPIEQHKAKGAVVVALRRWGVDDVPEDAGLLLLRLMTITSWRQADYEAEIARILADTGLSLSEALVGDSIVVDKDGSPHKVGEYVRGIVQMEQAERRTAAELAIKVLAANVAERQARLAEQQGALVADAIRAVLADLGHELSDPAVMRVVSSRLQALAVA